MDDELDTIGKNSKLSLSDAEWLSILSDALYTEGWYMKAIYLDKLIEHAKDNNV